MSAAQPQRFIDPSTRHSGESVSALRNHNNLVRQPGLVRGQVCAEAMAAAEEVDPYAKCKQKVYSYKAPWNTYSLAWSNSLVKSEFYRLAVGSFIEKYENSVHVRCTDTRTRTHARTHAPALVAILFLVFNCLLVMLLLLLLFSLGDA